MVDVKDNKVDCLPSLCRLWGDRGAHRRRRNRRPTWSTVLAALDRSDRWRTQDSLASPCQCNAPTGNRLYPISRTHDTQGHC